MSSIGTGYDLSATTYSPDGRLYQIEYAQKAVQNSGTVIGICAKDGVVLAVQKFLESKMMVKQSNKRIYTVDKHIGLALAGWKPDTRQIVNRARKECANYQNFYGTKIPGHIATERLSSYMHLYTLYWHLRPFGASVLVAAYDDKGPSLWMIEPSGTSWGYHACAIGKGRQAAKTELEKLKFEELTCKDAVKEAARIIYTTHDQQKDKEFELEMSWVCEDSKRMHQLVPQELKEEAIRLAKEAAKEQEESSDEELEDQD